MAVATTRSCARSPTLSVIPCSGRQRADYGVRDRCRGRGLTSSRVANATLLATARAPYYPSLRENSLLSAGVEWREARPLPAERVVEWVTIPNNPDGATWPPLFPEGRLLHDLVYHWPSLTNVTPRSDSVMLFSLCKLAGYCPARFGWALVRDPRLAEAMRDYVMTTSAGPGVADALLALRVFRVLRAEGESFFSWIRSELAARWERFKAALPPALGAIDRSSTPGALYVWVRCSAAALMRWTSCAEAFRGLGVLVNDGTDYAATVANARVAIGQHAPVFDTILERIRSSSFAGSATLYA